MCAIVATITRPIYRKLEYRPADNVGRTRLHLCFQFDMATAAAACAIVATIALLCDESAGPRDVATFYGDPGIRILFWNNRNCSKMVVEGKI